MPLKTRVKSYFFFVALPSSLTIALPLSLVDMLASVPEAIWVKKKVHPIVTPRMPHITAKYRTSQWELLTGGLGRQ